MLLLLPPFEEINLKQFALNIPLEQAHRSNQIQSQYY